jgi:hypothetical protein
MVSLRPQSEPLQESEMAHRQPEFLQDYERWMEDMFGKGWQGNRRVSVQD